MNFTEIQKVIDLTKEKFIQPKEYKDIDLVVRSEGKKGKSAFLGCGDGFYPMEPFAFAVTVNNYLEKTKKEVEPGQYRLKGDFLVKHDEETVHQVFSPMYCSVPDYQILQELQKQGIKEIRYRNNWYHSLIEGKNGGDGDGNGGQYTPMILVKNSEVGASSCRVMKGIFRLVCTNGLIKGDYEESWKRRHVGDKIELDFSLDETFIEQVEELQLIRLGRYEETPQNITRKILEALPLQEVDKYPIRKKDGSVAKKSKGRYTMVDAMQDELSTQSERVISLFTVVNALTRIARVASIDTTLRMQQVANQIIREPKAIFEKAGVEVNA